MMAKQDRIQVALASDERYFEGLLVTAGSIALHASPDRDIDLHVIDGGISDNSFHFLLDTLQRLNPRIACHRLFPDKAIFDRLPSYCGSKMTFLRILLPELLAGVDSVIYCDVDFLWCHDIARLWDLRRSDVILQSVSELLDKTLATEERWGKEQAIDLHLDTYFCAGLCLFNLARMRACGTFSAFMDFIARHKDVQFADQSVLNAILRSNEDYALLPLEWQRYTYNIRQEHVDQPFVLHYAGATPWSTTRILSDAVLLWFRFDAKLRRQSTWKSVRRYYSPFKVFGSRLFFLVATSTSLGWAVRLLLKAFGREGVITFLRPFRHTPR